VYIIFVLYSKERPAGLSLRGQFELSYSLAVERSAFDAFAELGGLLVCGGEDSGVCGV